MVGLSFLVLLTGCDTPTGGRSLSEAARLRLTEAADRNNPDAPDQFSLDVLRQQAQQNPNNLTIQDRFAAGALAAGLPADAATAMRRALAIAGPSQTRLLDLGRAEIRAGNGDGAAEALRRAEQSGPPNAAVFGALGLANDMNGDSAAAEAAHRRAVALAPQDWGLRGNLALSLMFAGRAAEGIRAISNAEGDSSAPRRARHNLALLLAADGQTDRAARILRNEMGPSEADAMMRDYQSFAQWAGTARRDQPRLSPERVPAPIEPVALAPVGPSPFDPIPGQAAPTGQSPFIPAPVRVEDVPPVVTQPPSRSPPTPTTRGRPSQPVQPAAIRESPPPRSDNSLPTGPAATIITAPDIRSMEPVIGPGDPGAASQPRRRRGAAVTSPADTATAALDDAARPSRPAGASLFLVAASAPALTIAPRHYASDLATAPTVSRAVSLGLPRDGGTGSHQVQIAALGGEAEAQRM